MIMTLLVSCLQSAKSDEESPLMLTTFRSHLTADRKLSGNPSARMYSMDVLRHFDRNFFQTRVRKWHYQSSRTFFNVLHSRIAPIAAPYLYLGYCIWIPNFSSMTNHGVVLNGRPQTSLNFQSVSLHACSNLMTLWYGHDMSLAEQLTALRRTERS